MELDLLPHDHISADPMNVRRHFKEGPLVELADSIHEYGLLENLVVKRGQAEGQFYIVAGERRWRAIGRLIEDGRWPTTELVPAMIIDGEGTFENLVENITREEVSPWDLGFRFNELAEAGYTQLEIGARVGKGQGMVSRHSAIARGLHPASVDRLNKMRTKLTMGDLMKVSALLDADKKPDEKAQAELIELLAGTRKHRKRRRAKRTDVGRMTRRLDYLRTKMRVPRHAQPYVNGICAYLMGETRTIDFPEEL